MGKKLVFLNAPCLDDTNEMMEGIKRSQANGEFADYEFLAVGNTQVNVTIDVLPLFQAILEELRSIKDVLVDR